ncbi:MAG: L-proline glycine betaine ABC transport system permease protein ProW, partial [uncultured Solirubrobacterales bacterium]
EPAGRPPRSARDPQPHRWHLRIRGRLLPRLDHRQPRSLRSAAARAHLPDRDLGRRRLRHLLCAGAAGPPQRLADRADHGADQRSLHDPEHRAVPDPRPGHGPHRSDRDHRARRLHPGLPVSQHHQRPRERPRGDQGRRAGDGAYRPPGPLACGDAARRPGDPRGAADRYHEHGQSGDARLLRRSRRSRRPDLPGHHLPIECGGGGRTGHPPRGGIRPDLPRRPACGHAVAAGGGDM